MEDRGFLPASTLHSLNLEDSYVKRIRARFSDSPDLNSPSQSLRISGFLVKALTSVYPEVGITAAGPSPTLTGFPFPGYHLFNWFPFNR